MAKKSIIVLALLVLTLTQVNAQHYVGLKGGMGAGVGRFYPTRPMHNVWGLPTAAVMWKYYSSEKFLGGIGIEAEYVKRGIEYELYMGSDTSRHYAFNSLIIPFMWQPNAELFKGRMRVFINLGVTLSYNFNANMYYVSPQDGVFRGEKYEFLTYRDNRWGYGLCGGLGLTVKLFPRFDFMVEARYHYGYSDFLKNRNKYPTNPIRSTVDNLGLSAGFFYRLGKLDKQTVRLKSSARRAAKEIKKLKQTQQDGDNTSTESI